MDLVSRLRTFMSAQAISNSQFADTCGIPRPTLSQILAGRNKKISDELISKIHAAYPWLNVMWLLFGEGEMTDDAKMKISEPQNQSESIEINDYSAENEQYSYAPDDSGMLIDFGLDNLSADNRDLESSCNTDCDDSYQGTERDKAQLNDNIERLEDCDALTESDKNTRGIADVIAQTQIGTTSKRIKTIVVFYDDNSFESFLPSE